MGLWEGRRTSVPGSFLPTAIGILLISFLLATVVSSSSSTAIHPLDLHGLQSLLGGVKNHGLDLRGNHAYCELSGIRCKGGRIVSIRLEDRGLSGYLGSAQSLSSLETLSLKGNALFGRIPSLSGLRNLSYLDLSSNSFTSFTHDFLRNLPALETININNLPLKPWSIPLSVAGCQSLRRFYAENSSITGSFPPALATLKSLWALSLALNRLSGELPSWVGGFEEMRWLNIASQKFSGPVEVLSHLKRLESLQISDNRFSGRMPDVSVLKNLQVFWLDRNMFSGLVPQGMSSMAKLRSLNMANNFLQGPIPRFHNLIVANFDANGFCHDYPAPCSPKVDTFLKIAAGFGFPLNLAESWVGNEPCNNWVGVTCSALSVITGINLHAKGLTGVISDEFAKLDGLQSLVLSDNQLDGSVPISLIKMRKLLLIDLSNNTLGGKVPVFKPFVKVYVDGNRFEPTSPSTGGLKWSKSVIIASICISLPLICIGIFICYKMKSKPLAEFICNRNLLQLLPEDVAKATNGFCRNRIIGKGGYGEVFRGEYNGIPVALKRSLVGANGVKGKREFLSEIEVLAKVQHRNILKLLGFCIEGNLQVLIYEYMSKGSLSRNLFNVVSTPLTLAQRLSIAFDIATGVQHLHRYADSTYVHRDLKCDNILLDENLRAVVADFGLVKKITGTFTFTEKGPGTLGYMPQEYFYCGHLSVKVDIYALGVIFLELLTGKGVCSMPEGESLFDIVPGEAVDQEVLKRMMDISLILNDAEWVILLKIANLAQQCVSRSPQNRPDIGHVVLILGNLLPSWCPEDDESHSATMQVYEETAWLTDDDECSSATIQVDEETTGLMVNDLVLRTNKPISCELGPVILGNIFDGSQRPLKTICTPRGISVPALSKGQLWELQPNKLGVTDATTNGDLRATQPLWTRRPVPSKLAADTPLLTGQYSNSKIMVYVGDLERANQMAEVLMDFPQLTITLPDGHEELVMKRITLVANTSNMPVAAYEIFNYAGIVVSEYIRDMGFNVSLMADSKYTWAKSLSEISRHLAEMRADSGYPAYLASRLSYFYEHAEKVQCLGSPDRTASLTIVGAVFPPGGDLSDHVTSATPRIVQVFCELDKKLAQRNHFHSVNWLIFHSKYPTALEFFYGKFDSEFLDMRTKALQREDDLNETVQLFGKDALGEGDKITVETDKLLREDYLAQNAFTLYDKYCPLYKSAWIMRNIIHFNTLANQAVERAAIAEGQKITYNIVKNRECDQFYRLVSQKFEDPAEGEDILVAKFQKL